MTEEEKYQEEKVKLFNSIAMLRTDAANQTLDWEEYQEKRRELLFLVARLRGDSLARLAKHNSRCLEMLEEKKKGISNESTFNDYRESCMAFIASDFDETERSFYNNCLDYLNASPNETDFNIVNESKSIEDDFKQ